MAPALSINEAQFIKQGFESGAGLRSDGRKLHEAREIQVRFRRSEGESQAEVQWGKTRINAAVAGEIVPPKPHRPTEGFLSFNVDLSPMAFPEFDGKSNALSVSLARIIDRGIRMSKALDTEALAIIAGDKVWSIKCDIHVLDHGGNLVDAAAFAAIAALMHFRRPEVTVVGNSVLVHSANEKAAIPLSLHHIPVCVSYSFVQTKDDPIVIADPTEREEAITEGNVTYTFNSFRELCAVHQLGGTPVSSDVILQFAMKAEVRASQLIDMLKKEAEKADEIDTIERRQHMRGKQFVDSSVADTAFHNGSAQEVELGNMTDFATLHEPIPLREQAEGQQESGAQAELMKTLEKAAASGPESGLDFTTKSRAEFQAKVTEFAQAKMAVDAPHLKEKVQKQTSLKRTKQTPKKKSKAVAKKQEESSSSDEEDDLSAALK